MYRTFFVFLKCTIQGGPKVNLLLIAYLNLWLKFLEGIDKYWIVPVRNYSTFTTEHIVVETESSSSFMSLMLVRQRHDK